MQATMRQILPVAIWMLAGTPLPACAQVEASPSPSARPNFGGAIGLQWSNAPRYQGSNLRENSLQPGIYLRWGRFWVATAGNFVTRQDGEVLRGVGAELVQRDDLRVRLGLRLDPGRKTRDSPELAELDDIRPTVRARLSATWRFKPDWQLGTGWSTDVLGRQGGSLVDLSISHSIRLSQRTHWSLGSSLSWADERYMLARFGISPAAAARTGRPAYEPGGGWRDAALNTELRTDIDRRWSVWAGASVSRLLRPALASPLTLKPTQVATGAGFAWRF